MFETGQILQERYQLQKRLGHTMAGRQTWLASDLESKLNEPVILKFLAFTTEMQWDTLKLFEREAQVLKHLDHPRIPKYRDYFSVNQQVSTGLLWWGLVQDYIPGNTLQDALKQGQKFSVAEVLNFAQQILQILVYLHELSPPVLHRDIKPSNLILAAEQQIYLVDFGAVQDQAAVTGMTFTVVGTSGYTPLEQFWGRSLPASDLYALGATLIHILTGVAPSELPQKNLQIQFSDRVSLPSNIVLWIQKLAQPDVEKRFHTARQALKVLDQGEISNLSTNQPSVPIQTLRSVSNARIAKPPETRVFLEKSAKKLEIHQPDLAASLIHSKVSADVIPTMIGGSLFLVLISLIPAKIGLFYLAPLLMPFLIGFVFYRIFNAHAYSLSTHLFLDVERNCFEIQRHYMRPNGKKFKQETQAKGSLESIQYALVTRQDHDPSPASWSITLIPTPASWSITLIADSHHSLGTGFTGQECLWLVQEIQDWLEARAKPNEG